MHSRVFALCRPWLLLAGISAAALLVAQSSISSSPEMALVHATVWTTPEEDPIRDGVVVIRDGKIAAVGSAGEIPIPPGAQTLDCSGKTVTAGFFNSHVHFMERKWANAARIPPAELSAQLTAMLTRYGVTSAFDTGSTWENTRTIRDRIEAGEIPGPKIRSTGEILYPKGTVSGSPPVLMDALGFMRAQVPEVANETEATEAARKLLDAGTDGIKLYAATWFPPFADLPDSAIRAAVEEAHRRGKLVFAHPTKRDALLASVRGGVDILVHTTPQSGPWDQTVLSTMKEKQVALIPTLKLWQYELRHDRISDQKRFVETAVGQLRAWVAAGGTVLFGTDVGYLSDYDPGEEYALMARSGMNFRQILASLTTAPAQRFGEGSQRGRVAKGFVADLVVLNDDPSEAIRALTSVRYTVRSGAIIYRDGNSDEAGTAQAQ